MSYIWVHFEYNVKMNRLTFLICFLYYWYLRLSGKQMILRMMKLLSACEVLVAWFVLFPLKIFATVENRIFAHLLRNYNYMVFWICKRHVSIEDRFGSITNYKNYMLDTFNSINISCLKVSICFLLLSSVRVNVSTITNAISHSPDLFCPGSHLPVIECILDQGNNEKYRFM